jgi:hypothetical protein
MELNINELVSVFDCRCFSDMELTLMNLSVYLIAGFINVSFISENHLQSNTLTGSLMLSSISEKHLQSNTLTGSLM